MSSPTQCPKSSFLYNSTLCSCNPGYYFANSTCVFFNSSEYEWMVSSGFSPGSTFLTTVLPIDTIKKFTQSQAVLLEATLVLLLAWLFFCFAVRLGKIDGGRSVWFKIRWWISRLDMFFDTNHWAEDNKVVIKRKTELGGTCSVASWILFIGLLSVLLYQIIAKRSIEVHRVRPANAPDLLSFVNDLEFNITTISGMTCSNLRGPDTLVVGTPGFIDYRIFPLSTYVKKSCENTSSGPMISLKCSNCQIPRKNHFISWQFVDLPNNPALAVGFQFNLSAKDHSDDKHVSFVSGTIKSERYTDDKPKTYRGSDGNVLRIQLFPQEYIYLKHLKLVQPLFNDFIPGTFFSDVNGLKASLQNSDVGLINTTLYISYLSDYIVEINKENVTGPVGFLANIGGLFAFSFAIFLCLLVQCEARITKFRHEDTEMRNVVSRKRAKRNWDKVRKFVMYTWGPSNLDERNDGSERRTGLTVDSSNGLGASKKKQQSRNDAFPS